MCGIAGFIGDFPAHRIEPMLDSIAHRGPDDVDHWHDVKAGVCLGHRRLSIIDLSNDGRQPMTNEDGTLQIVFNGEIYNYQELRAELIARGHTFRSATDTEVIVHLYEEEGLDAFARLNGMYAFALWDARTNRLLLVRDPVGIKPLYYHVARSGLAFASELKALTVFPEIGRELNPIAVHQHLSFVWAASPHTMLKAVKKLEPGHFLEFGQGRVTRHASFQDLPYDGQQSQGSLQEHITALQDQLRQAVRRQMVSDVPVAAFLSGGMDSSSVVALMRESGVERPRCYTIGLAPGSSPDENPEDLPYAQALAKEWNCDLCEVNISPDVISFAENMVYMLDEPQADPACINVWLICQQARADGYKVLLSGAGGDDVFTGYRRHVALGLEKYWAWLPAPLRKVAAWGTQFGRADVPWQRRLKKALRTAAASPVDRLLSYFVWLEDASVRPLLSADFRRELAGYDPLDPLRQSLARIPWEKDRLQQMLYLEGKHFLPDHNLNYTDKMAMAHGVEVRVPLLDLELVKFAARLPSWHKQRGRQSKYLFKEAMRPYLPASVLTRPKTGFGAPLRRWIRNDLRSLVRDVLSPEAVRSRGIFDAREVTRLVERNEQGTVDASYAIFTLMCIEMWARRFVDSSLETATAG